MNNFNKIALSTKIATDGKRLERVLKFIEEHPWSAGKLSKKEFNRSIIITVLIMAVMILFVVFGVLNFTNPIFFILLIGITSAVLVLHAIIGSKHWTSYMRWYEIEIEPYIYVNNYNEIVKNKKELKLDFNSFSYRFLITF